MMSSRARSGELEEAAVQFRVGAHAAHVYLREGKAFCFMSGPDAVHKAREAVRLPFDSITEVKRVPVPTCEAHAP